MKIPRDNGTWGQKVGKFYLWYLKMVGFVFLLALVLTLIEYIKGMM